jgi:hypothetical protein
MSVLYGYITLDVIPVFSFRLMQFNKFVLTDERVCMPKQECSVVRFQL